MTYCYENTDCRAACLLRLQRERFSLLGGSESADDLDGLREFCDPPPFRARSAGSMFTRLGRQNMVSMLGGLGGPPPPFPSFDGKWLQNTSCRRDGRH